MSLWPEVVPGNNDQRVAQAIADVRRQLDGVSRVAGFIPHGVITGGVGGHITAASITSAEILAGTITATNIAANTITAGQIAANTITAAQIAANTITAGQIAASTITATELAASSVTTAKMAAGTIDADRLTAGSITATLLAATTAFSDGLLSRLINATNITTSGLSAVSAALGTVTAGTMRIGAVGGSKTAIGDNISTSAGTKSGIVGTDSSNNITFWMDSATGTLQLKGSILTGSSGLGNISGAINGGTNITSGTITEDRLVAHSITAASIAAASITATELQSNSVIAAKIQAGAVDATKIAAGTITATQLAATAIDVMTITGATFRSAASGQRVEMTSAGIKKYDASGNVAVQLGNANGLDVLASTVYNTIPNDRAIRWLDPAGGSIVTGLLYGATATAAASATEVRLRAIERDAAATYANVGLSALSETGTEISYVIASTTTGVTVGAGGTVNKTLISDTGQSNFIQLNTAADVRAAYGHGSVTGNGTAQVAAPAISHGLGRTAVSAYAVANDPLYVAAAFVSSSTQITVQVRRTDGATFVTTPSFDWFVLG